MNKNKIKNMTLCGLMTALIAVIAQISLPSPLGVPITLQTFAVSVTGYLLGVKYGVLSTLLYLILGAIGVPVFSHFQGGIHYLFASPTGGFLFGMLLLSVFTGLSGCFKWQRHERTYSLLLGAVGILMCHLTGSMQYSSIAGIPLSTAIAGVSLPFIAKDIISVILAYFFTVRLKKHI